MRILIKCHPRRERHWRWLQNEANEVWFASDREGMARLLLQRRIEHAIIEMHSIEEASLLDYIHRYHPNVRITLVTSSPIRAAIQSFKRSACMLIDSDNPDQLREILYASGSENRAMNRIHEGNGKSSSSGSVRTGDFAGFYCVLPSESTDKHSDV